MVAERIVPAAHDVCGRSRATTRPEAAMGMLIVSIYSPVDVRRCVLLNYECAARENLM